MKTINRIALIVGTFCLTWGLTKHFTSTGQSAGTNQSRKTVLPRASSSGKPGIIAQSQKSIAKALANAPVERWAALWQEFAEASTEQDLQKTASIVLGIYSHENKAVSDFLRTMAEEELAVRGSKAVVKKHGVAALAERDLEAAWNQVLAAKAGYISSAFLRTLASTDPQAALEKAKLLGKQIQNLNDSDYFGEIGVYYSNLSALFSAWARRNPAAAAAAAENLGEEDKKSVQWAVALGMAYSDGPAGLTYILQHCMDGEDGNTQRMLSPLLRAALSQDTATTKRVVDILSQHPSWMEVEGYTLYNAIGPWYRTDPEGANAFLAGLPPTIAELRQWAEHDAPAAMASLEVAEGKTVREVFPFVTVLFEEFPERIRALAAKHGLTKELTERLERYPVEKHPKDRVDKFLNRLAAKGLEKVVASFPLTGETEIDILEEMLAAAQRFHSEAVPTLESAITRVQTEGLCRKPNVTHQNRLPENDFAYDPAAASKRLQEKGLRDWDAWDAVDYWAPYDFTAAKEWVLSLPDGPAKANAEIALLEHDYNISGEVLLTKLLPLDPNDFKPKIYPEPAAKLSQLWRIGLTRIAESGGDWQAWLDKLPPAYKNAGMTQTQLDLLKERTVKPKAKAD